MARIFISAPAGILEQDEYKFAVFYEGFIKSLISRGHDIRAINSFNFLNHAWHGSNNLKSSISDEILKEKIRAFDPELIIAFNHSIPQCILDVTDCPVAVWDADSLPFYNDKDYISNNIERYSFLCFSNAGVQNALRFGAKQNSVHMVLAGTSVEAEPAIQNKNISFIGTLFTIPHGFIKLLKERGPDKIKPLVEDLRDNFYESHEQILLKHNAKWAENYIDTARLASISSTQLRASILNDITELGLTIFGDDSWLSVGEYLPWLAMSYKPEKVYSLKHNQDIYNSSKICINISHTHAVDGFPWRIMDIMASNGCLLSDRKTGLVEFTKGFVDIPMYDNRAEAYDLCKKLLNDDIWRKEIVSGSQECIKAKGLWSHRIKDLEDIFGLHPDVAAPAQTYESAVLNSRDFLKPELVKLIKILRKISPFVPAAVVKWALRLITPLSPATAEKINRLYKLGKR